MKIHFERPWFLILIPIALFLFIYMGKKLKLNKLKKRTLLVVRSLLMIVLIFSLCGINFVWKAKDTTTLFLVDSSDSVNENKAQMEEFIGASLNHKNKNDSVGIMSFGKNTLMDNFISKKVSFSGLHTEPIKTHTNIENAIVNSLINMGEKNKKRIVLITDGKENIGKSSKLISTLKEQNVDLKVYKVGSDKNKKDVAVEGLEIPENVRIGQEFQVMVNVNSNVDTNCNIKLFSDNLKRGEQRVKVSKGQNRFIFKDKAETGGFKTYKVLIEPDLDEEVKNNEFSSFTNVKDKAKVLVIKNDDEDAAEIINMLKASNIDFQVVKAGSEPSNIKNLSKYKIVITCNVSCETLSEGFLNSLKTYVKDLGGGLIAVGGENSFALGGYSKTPLEEVLPVHMDMRGKKEIPQMSMMLVIDRSGSMADDKIELAKEAAARTVDFLRDKDEIGVLAFDDAQYWVVKRQNVKDRKSIRDAIGTIRGGGGTSILPGLYEAYNSLKNSKAEIKHIILLTDGQAEKEGYDTLIRDFKNKKITVSTVAIGGDSDKDLLEHIAKGAAGRFYYTDNYDSIPKIFAKEAFTVARTYLNNKQFTPIVQSNHPVLSGVAEQGFPDLFGYIGATPKNSSKVILKSPEDDPILTLWQYGLGKTVAWNSDMSGKWSKNFISWEKNLNLWQNIVNWSTENYNNESMQLNTRTEGDTGIIEVEDKDLKSKSQIEADIITPSMKNIKVKLHPTEIGKFSGEFKLDETGAYIIKAKEIQDGQIINAVMGGMTMQYSPEYTLTKEEGTLDALVKGVGGKYITSSNEVFQGEIKDIYTTRDVSEIFIALALILFLLDIAIRRLELPYEKIQNKLKFMVVGIKRRIYKNKTSIKKDMVQKETYISNLNSIKQKSQEKIDKSVNLENKDFVDEKHESSNDRKIKDNTVSNVEETGSLNTSELLKAKKKRR